jgi:hypothetical protein
MKKMYVIFRGNDAEVFVNQRPDKIKKKDLVLVDPDLSRVEGVSPHYWKLVGSDNLIFPMNAAERAIKHATHRDHYRNLNGFHVAKLLRRVFFGIACIVLGVAVTYYLFKSGRIK